MALNLISPTIFTTSVLVADTVQAPGGSTDAIPQLTQAGGNPVSAALELQATDAALLVPRMTTAQRDLMNVANGMCIYNTTIDAFQFLEGGIWTTPGPGGGDVVGPFGAVQNDIAIFADNTGKVLADSGVMITQSPAPFPPFANVPMISNVGGLSFISPESHISIGAITTQIISYDSISDTVTNVFVDNSAVPPFPTTQSCLVELNSTQGALVVSRMTTVQKLAMTPTNGMVVYDTTLGKISAYQNGSWQTLDSLPWTTEGDMLYYSAGVGARLPIGPNLSFLHSNGIDPEWYGQAYDDGGSEGSVGFGTDSLSTSPNPSAANSAFGNSALFSLASGENNSAFGCFALESLTTGFDNMAVGFQSLVSLTTGNENCALGSFVAQGFTTQSDTTSFGYESLSGTTTGGSTTCAFGSQTLDLLQIGDSNNAFGFNSMFGADNTSNNCGFGNGTLGSTAASAPSNAFGNDALTNLSTGINNSIFGYQGAQFATTANNCSGFGHNTLTALTTGANNSCFGSLAGASVTTGAQVTAVGYSAASTCTTGTPTAVGYQALLSLTTSNSSAFGNNALSSLTTTDFCSAFGRSALALFTGASSCSAFGDSALAADTTGAFNSAFGRNSSFMITTGGSNSSFGTSTLTSLTTGNSNAVFGTNSAQSMATNSNNAAFGRQSFINLVGDQNCGLGSNVLNGATGSNNVAVGYSAGNNQTSYSNCIFIGSSADASANGLTNACAIGTNTQVGVSNAMVLGNGCFVGIGKNSPAYSLHLGTDNSSTPLLYMASTAVPSTPATANDGIFSVNTGKPKFTSGTTQYQGTIATAITTGTAATAGSATLNGTTGVTVNTTAITTSSIVLVTSSSGAGAPTIANIGALTVGSIVANTSFVIYSTNASHNTTVKWLIINP